MMKPYENHRIVILGMGYLMEYIYPCYEAFCGSNLSTNVLAVTADRDDLARKQQACAFSVILDDCLGALARMEPDLILFAPPPAVAPSLIEEVLAPYYSHCREAGRPLPLLFAFAPTPGGDTYLDKLGDDLSVVNILPNMVTEIAGERLEGMGLTYLTFPSRGAWAPAHLALLQDFFAPMGGTIAVKPRHLMPMLAGTVVVHNISEVIFTITDSLAFAGHPVAYTDIAGCMRAAHQEHAGIRQSSIRPCSSKQVDTYLAAQLGAIVRCWRDQIRAFYVESGLPQADAELITDSLLDLHLALHQAEKREVIEAAAKGHATPGGVLEKGTVLFYRLLQGTLRKAFCDYPRTLLEPSWFRRLEDSLALVCNIVSEHGAHLSTGGKFEPFEIKNHAVLFGLIARQVLASGAEGARESLAWGVMRYGRERGGRMRQRCDDQGDPVNMLSYKAYCEWQPENEVMTSVDIQKSPVHITQVRDCHWINDWKAYGLLEYGKYYCDYADFHLVKGFSDHMHLEMTEIYSRGCDFCGFIWCGADLTEENEAWVNKRRNELIDRVTLGWDYHTAHLYFTVYRAVKGTLGQLADRIFEEVRREYAALFSWEALSVIDAFACHDFAVGIYRSHFEGQPAER